MVRTVTLSAVALAMTLGGTAIADQANGKRAASGDAAAGAAAAAPAQEAPTEVKGVYSTKSVMGISTGQPASAEADASDVEQTAAGADEDGTRASD